MLKRGLLLFVALFLLLSLIVFISAKLTGNNSIEGMANIQVYLNDISLLMTIFRIGVLGMVYHYWNNICQWYGNKKEIGQEYTDKLIQSKSKIMIWLIAIEILINQNLIGFIIEKIT